MRRAGRAVARRLLAALIVLAAPVVARAACPPGALTASPEDSIAALAAVAPPGQRFCLEAGLHRLEQVAPKDGQQFFGEPGAVMSGAVVVEGFERSGAVWRAALRRAPAERRKRDECLPDFPDCDDPLAVFIEDAPLLRAPSREALAPGRFYWDGDAGRIELAEDPAGRRVEATQSAYAFLGGAVDVVIDGLTIEKYASPIQYGAVGYNRPGRGWRVTNNRIRLNYGVGLVIGPESLAEGNVIERNGQMGFGCNGEGIRVERNVIRANGGFAGLDPLWEGGGAKCAVTTGLLVRGNWLTANYGFGFWTDIDNIDTRYEGNLFERNLGGGVSHEISYAAEILDNVFLGNGPREPHWLWGCAVQVQDSRDVLVADNLIDMRGGGQGVCVIEQDRGDGAYGPYRARQVSVERNLIIADPAIEGRNGAISDHDPSGMAQGGNCFDANRYVIAEPETGERWAWVDGFYDWAGYRARSGQDAASLREPGPPGAEVEARILQAAEAIRRGAARAVLEREDRQ